MIDEKMDEQELGEREEAAQAYAAEDEKHLIDYITDCLNTSVKANADVRQAWADCWKVFNEDEPSNYAKKAFWQSRIVVPKPFQSVMYAASALKRAFSPECVTVEDALSEVSGNFWLKVVKWAIAPGRGDFASHFVDAATMGLAVGQGLEIIPRWIPSDGKSPCKLELTLAEPWKIARDPDAPRRDPQGGMYWIHTEWLDYHVLVAGEKSGRFYDVKRVYDCTTSADHDPMMSTEAVARRKMQLHERSSFRRAVQTREFWGQVLDPKGNLLLPRATMTMAGERLIQRPVAVRYRKLRWPGISFSPLPSMLGFGGRGLLQGVQRIWEAMNNLMCLHEDALKWLVNPPHEICTDVLDDPRDVIRFPGRDYITRLSPNGQQAVRPVQRRDVTAPVLANIKNYDDFFQRGSMLPDVIAGLPGHRAEVTAREHSQNLNQAQGIYSLMGSNIEMGAAQCLLAFVDVIATTATLTDYRMMAPEFVDQLKIDVSLKGEIENLPQFDGRFAVSAITSMMRDAEVLDNLLRTWVPLLGHPKAGPYLRTYNLLKSLEKRTNIKDEEILIDSQTAQSLEMAENTVYANNMKAAQEAQQLAREQQVLGLAMQTADAAAPMPPPQAGGK